ncbi:uncharacterized protein LOC125043000 [Penaeus chinensis]|uniref:uncharacterized protein LOC125043000 n=1 Tax=Penaeus chinensis TaxID=139456 RepID=UPI001FB57DD8|nr:uncharacterized protein LOC125043000 [Penaeus chinensis]XP_047494877.1 uncharacterized protein LOC125043000 [Penaeus chinensis]
MASSIPAPATFARLHHTIKHIQRILAEVHRNFSLLNGRSLDDFFEQEKSNQLWAKRMFVDHRDIIESDTPPEEFDCHLLYKMIKYMDKLASYSDPVWESNSMDSIESLVYYVYREWDELKEAFTLSEQSLSHRLDSVQDALVRIVTKIEGKKGIDLKHLKVEVHKEFNSSLSTSFPYIYKVSAQHSIHRMLVLLYKQLNQLNGKSVEVYRKEKFDIRNPLFAFTPAEKMMLRKNICPEKMPIRLVFKLLERVCGLERQKSPAWSEKSDRVEYLLTCIIKNHQDIVYSAQNLDYDWPYELFQLFEKALDATVKVTGRMSQEIMKEMPDEPVHLNEAYSCSVLCKSLTSYDSFGAISDSEPSSISDSEPSSISDSEPSSISDSEPSSPSSTTPSASLPSLESLSIEEINIACLFQALCSKGPAVRTMVTVFRSFKGDIEKIKSSNKKKVGLTNGDVKKLENGEPLENLDITLLYKLIQGGCEGLAPQNDPVWYTPGDTLEYHLYLLKYERNTLFHSRISLTEKELKEKLKKIWCMLKYILEETERQAKINLTVQILEIKKDILRLEKPPVRQVDVDTYRQEVKMLREQLCYDLLQKCRKELSEKYNQASAKLASPVTWSLHPAHKKLTIEKVFTEPEIDYSRSELKLKSTLSLLDTDLQSSNKVILYGVAGTGKTSICQFLAYTWANKDEHDSTCDILILIKCKTTSQDNLVDFLLAFLPESMKGVQKNDIIVLMQNLKSMFIVDAYDEATNQAKELISDILHTLPRSTIIITTKQHAVSYIEMKVFEATGSDCMLLKVLGFGEDRQKEYVRNFFQLTLTSATSASEKAEADRICTEMESYLDSLDKCHREFVSLPLTLSLLVILWQDNSKSAKEATTLTRLYQKIIRYTLKRFTPEDSDVRRWILALGKIAWQNMNQNIQCLTNKDVEKLLDMGDSLGLQKKQVLTAVLQSTSEDSTLDHKNYWTFSHNSQQEFLVAEHFVKQIVSYDRLLPEILKEYMAKELHRSLQVIEFVAGLLALENELSFERADDIISLISDQTPCTFEVIKRLAHDISSENEHFHSRLQSLFQDKELRQTLDNFDPDCLQWIIENTSIKIPLQVMLINSARSVIKMKTLLQTLTQKSSKPHIIATIDNMNDIKDLITFIEDHHELSVGYTLHIQNSVDLSTLIKAWNWHWPLCLRFPQIIFPLLWWELKVSLMAADIKLSSIRFSEDVTHAVDFRKGVEQLGLEWVADSSLYASEVVVTSITSNLVMS